jgi:hypothetical protein
MNRTTTPLVMAALSLIMSAFTPTAHAQAVQKQLAPSILGKPPIPITSLPLTITTPGYYYLLSDIYFTPTSMSNRIAITVNSSNVTIDLRGHSFSGPFQAEITVPEYFNLNPVGMDLVGSNITVKNGTISGFFYQLSIGSGSAQAYATNITITDVKFTGAGEQSLSLGNVNSSIVSNCSFGFAPQTSVIDDGSQTGNRYINDTFSGSDGVSPISISGDVQIILSIQPKANSSRN